MADIASLVDQLSKLTVVETADLVKKLESAWGVTAAAPVAMACRKDASNCSRVIRPKARASG